MCITLPLERRHSQQNIQAYEISYRIETRTIIMDHSVLQELNFAQYIGQSDGETCQQQRMIVVIMQPLLRYEAYIVHMSLIQEIEP
ncbi:hypothetical protein D3C72_2425680 [compost metagenome]